MHALQTQAVSDSQSNSLYQYPPLKYSRSCHDKLPPVQEQGNLMFSSPLQIHPSNEFSLDQLAFTTIYNLALATHVRSIRDHSLRFKSVQMWEMVYALHRRDGLRLQTHHVLAILMNLGHANLLMGNKRSSRTCYENIEMALAVHKERNQNVEHCGLFMSAAQFMLNPPMSAPAA